MKYFRHFLLYLFLFFSYNVISQASEDTSYTDYDMDEYMCRMDSVWFKEIAIRPSYAFNGDHLLDIGIFWGNLNYFADVPIPTVRHGIALTSGVKLGNKHPLFYPKLSYELHLFILTTKINTLFFTNFKNSNWIISPEIGLTLMGYIYLTYSKNVVLNKKDFYNPNHQINLGITLPKKNYKYIYETGN